MIIYNKKGISLIEVILYTSLVAVMLVVMTQFIGTIFESRTKNRVVNEVEQQGLQVMQFLGNTIRQANGVNVPIPNISLATLSLDSFGSNPSPSVFSLVSGKLQLVEDGAPTILTSDYIEMSNLLFTNTSQQNTPGSIRIEFTLNYLSNSNRSEYIYTKDFVTTYSLN